MKPLMLVALLITALVLAVTTIPTVSGDGEDELSVEEYFQQLQTISDDADERAEALENEITAAFDAATSEEASVDAGQRLALGWSRLTSDLLDELESLDPPPEVEEAHNEIVQVLRLGSETFESAAAQAAEAESLSELAEVYAHFEAQFDSAEIEAIHERSADACQALQGVASDNGIQFDLDCE